MEIIVESKGAKISKEGNCFLIEKVTGEKTKISPLQCEILLVHPNITFTTNAILLAMEKKCDIVFLDNYGHPKGRVWNSEFNSIPAVRRMQYEHFNQESGTEIAKKYICRKLEGFIDILKKYDITDDDISQIREAIYNIEILKGKPIDVRDRIMGYEGNSGRIFFNKISLVLPTRYQFEKRELQNAKSEFNILLNYCYGILYRVCEGSLIKKGIDPFLGILHSDSYNKKSFLFDFIEIFRPWAVSRVIEFIKKKYIRIDYFSDGELTTLGKSEIAAYFNKFLDGREDFKGKQYTRKEIINKEVEDLIRELRGDKNEISAEL